MFNHRFLRAVLSTVGTLSLAGAALAQPIVVSGGAMLPQPLYQDEIDDFPAPLFHPYAAIGSIAGKAAFLANTPASLGRTGAVHWVGSESILTTAQIGAYLKTGLGRLDNPAGHGPMIQIPAAGTAVTIAYKGPAAEVTLSKTQLCRVISGLTTRWSDLGVDPGSAPDSFHVIYHSDDSGVTELLTRHLEATCGMDSAVQFNGNSTFAQVFPSKTPPVNFIAASGSRGVVAALAGEVSAITYLGVDPAFVGALKLAKLINPYNGRAYAPTLEHVYGALSGTAIQPQDSGPVERRPDGVDWLNSNNQANPFNWVRSSVSPAAGYPIVGFTNFVFSQCYADPAVSEAIKRFLLSHYSARNSAADWGSIVFRPFITPQRAREMLAFIADKPNSSIAKYYRSMLAAMYDEHADPADRGALDQHQLMPLPPVHRTRLLSAFVFGTNANLDIGNPTVCSNYAGRG